MTPFSREAYELFHEGALALADIEATGIRVDVPYLNGQMEKLEAQILDINRRLWRAPEARQWKEKFGSKTNLESNKQLASILYGEMGYKASHSTRKGSASTNDDALAEIGTSFTDTILSKRKLSKVRDTYVAGLLKNQVNGLLHPSFNLHSVLSFRSSSDHPNFQNMPMHDREAMGIVRRAIVPHSPEDSIGEIDYKSAEVRIAACYHKDPAMIAYIEDPSKDLHLDMACECFFLKKGQVTKEIRYTVKGNFVFAAFYGSYFELMAPALWKNAALLGLSDRTPLRTWLREKGIKNLSDFTDHIETVENHFWNKRFPRYAKWKKDWHQQYLKRGWIEMLSGFRCLGPMSRNACINYPIQGASFHCLLWSLVQLQKWLVANEMKTRIIGQIHDSIVLNFAADELHTVLRKARKVMREDIRKHWEWIVVPMDIEAEVAPIGRPWNEKEVMEIIP